MFSTLIFIAGYPTNTWAEPCFDDEKLVQHLPTAAQPRPVLLYVWSPRMVYSVHNMAVAERAAAAQGLAFVLLHDARVPAEELSSLPLQNSNNLAPNPSADTNTHTHSNPNANPNDDPATPPSAALIGPSQPLCALALLRRDALRHFPTAFVLTVRGIHPQPIVGAMPASAWNLSLAAHLLP